jgi:hypothetical protein
MRGGQRLSFFPTALRVSDDFARHKPINSPSTSPSTIIIRPKGFLDGPKLYCIFTKCHEMYGTVHHVSAVVHAYCTASLYMYMYMYDDCDKATIVGGTRDLLDP